MTADNSRTERKKNRRIVGLKISVLVEKTKTVLEMRLTQDINTRSHKIFNCSNVHIIIYMQDAVFGKNSIETCWDTQIHPASDYWDMYNEVE